MCSNPQTQIMPDTGEVMEFACRVCNDCIATRRHQWMARAMAEKACWPFALAVTLTYADDTQENRDGASMFRYDDVRGFLKRLLSAARFKAKKEKLGFVPRVRFIAAGEQGSRNDRVHWHLVLFSDIDLCSLGEVSRKSGRVTQREDMISRRRADGRDEEKRLRWSMWDHGFVLMQEPDAAGVAYVLKYCLKDQFTAEKSAGTAREHKSEAFATGLFRMSKKPAIGEQWFWQKMQRLRETGAVLPSVQLKIPDMRNYWVPSGLARKRLLWALAAINRMVLWETGKDAPQWAALLHSVADSPYDRRILDGAFWFEEREKSRGDVTVNARDRYFYQTTAWHAKRRNWVIRCKFCWGDPEIQERFAGTFKSEWRQETDIITRKADDRGEARQARVVDRKHWHYYDIHGQDRGVSPERVVGPHCKCEACGDTRKLLAVPVSEYREGQEPQSEMPPG